MRHLRGYYVSCRNPLTKQENAFINLGCIFVAIRDRLGSFRLLTHPVDPTHPQTWDAMVLAVLSSCSKEGAATMPAPSPELKVIQLFGEGEGKQSCLSAPGRLAQHGGRRPPQDPPESEDVQWDAVARQHLQRLRSIALSRGERRQTMSDTPDATPCCRAVMS